MPVRSERRRHQRTWALAGAGAALGAVAGWRLGVQAAPVTRALGYGLSMWFLARGVAIVMRDRLLDLRIVYATQTSILATSFGILALMTVTGYTTPRGEGLPWAIWAWIGLFLFGSILGHEALVRASIRAHLTNNTRASTIPNLSRDEADTLLDRAGAEIRHARDAEGVTFGASQQAIGRLVGTLRDYGYLGSEHWTATLQAEIRAREAARGEGD